MPSALDSYTNSIYNHDLKILFPLFGGAGVGKTVVIMEFIRNLGIEHGGLLHTCHHHLAVYRSCGQQIINFQANLSGLFASKLA